MWSRCLNVPSEMARPLAGRLLAAALLAAALLAALLPAAVQAMEVEAAAQYTAEYTSNTLRTENDEIGEWVHQPGVDLRVEQDTASLEMDVDYSYIRRIFTKDIWTDEDRLVGTANVDWHALPERLDLFVNNTRTETTIAALRTSVRDNRQIDSTTEAGGRLRFQPRGADELQFEYVFRDVRRSRTNADSQRHNGTVRYLLGLSDNRGLVLQGTYSDIEYEGIFPDADYTVAAVGYVQSSGPVELELSVGYNWFDRVGRGQTSNPFYDGTVTWQATSTVAFSASVGQMITDQGSGLASGDTAYEDTRINAAFEETLGSLGYRHVLGANTLALEGYWIRQEYADDVPLSNTRTGARLDFARTMTRTTTLTGYADFSNRDFSDVGDDQDELRAGFRLEHRIGRSLSFNWGLRYEKRNAQVTPSYEEWIGSVQIYWTFLGASRGAG